jgi:hypothetical protein
MNAPTMEALAQRLEKVEQQNRRLRGAGIAVVVLAAAGLLMGQAMPRAQTVEAREFILRGAEGKVRADLVAFKDGLALTLLDESGKSRATLAVDKPGPRLSLYDENGKPRARLAVYEDGPALILLDENGMFRVSLLVRKAGPMLLLHDENDKTIWRQP